MGQSEQGEDFPNNDQSFTSNITSINSKDYGDANAHTAAIELLEVHTTAHATTKSHNQIAINLPPSESCLNPNVTNLNDHTRRASR